MKMTNREKKLLFILFIVAFGAIYYQFVYLTQQEKIAQKQEELTILNEKINIEKGKIDPNNELEQAYKVINSKDAQVSERFFPFIMQEKLITLLDGMITQTGLEVSSISFSKAEIAEIKKEKEKKEQTSTLLQELVNAYLGRATQNNQASQGEENEEDPTPVQIKKMSATVNFEGTYEQLTDFIKIIEGHSKKILIENIVLAGRDESGEQIAGNMLLNFYAVPKIQVDEEYYKWDYKGKYGRDNPFEPFAGYEYPTNDLSQKNSKTKSSTNNKVQQKKYDFYIGVHPISADIPSVIIGKANDPQAKTYVYADNAEIENVEFRLLQKEDKYYYKYKTQSESYPQDYEASMIEFTPNGRDAVLSIISSKRKDDQDTNGMNLLIVNESDLQLKVDVAYDDPTRPRVMIKREGKVVVN